MASRPGPQPLTPSAERREKEEEVGARSEKEPAVAAALPRHLGKGRRAARRGEEKRGTVRPAARLCRRSAGERPPAGSGAAASPPSFPSLPRQGPAGPGASAGRRGRRSGGWGALWRAAAGEAAPCGPAPPRRLRPPAAALRAPSPRGPSAPRGHPELLQPYIWLWNKYPAPNNPNKHSSP